MTNENYNTPRSPDAKDQPIGELPAVAPAPLTGTLPNDRAGQGHDEKSETKELAREFRVAEKWVIGTNILLAIIGIFALYIYHGQLTSMQGQLGEMKSSGQQTNQLICLYRQQLGQLSKQATDTHELATQAKNQADRTKDVADGALAQARATNKLADQARRSADAARDTAAVATETMYTDLRAWLSLSDISTFVPIQGSPPKNEIEIGKPLYIRTIIQNIGKTPALQVRVAQKIIPVETEGEIPYLAPEADYSQFPVSMVGTVMPTTAGSPYTGRNSDAPISRSLEKSTFDAIKSNRLHYFVVEKISYCDFFNHEHWLTYCAHLLSGGRYAMCDDGNDIDRYEKPVTCSLK